MPEALEAEGITVRFGGLVAVNAVSLRLAPGGILGLIGPNGAGKTTMMDVITGKTRPDKGTAFFGPKMDLTRMTEYEIASAGIGRKFQKPTVFPEHSVYENLELAMRADKRVWPSLFARMTGEQRDRIDAVLHTVMLASQRRARAAELSHGQKQWLEIGMLLTQEPKVLLVDEPIAGMTHQEAERTAELLVGLAGRHSVMVVEHDMGFVRSIARKVTVLHEGRVLMEGSMDEVQGDPRVVEVYLGA